jgi:hypothetical protein
MTKSVQRLERLLLDDKRATIAIVVGDVRLESLGKTAYLRDDQRSDRYIVQDIAKGTMINTSEIVADVLESNGFCIELIIDDHINESNVALRSFLKPNHGCTVDRIVIARRRFH